jgi:hypothetical protein
MTIEAAGEVMTGGLIARAFEPRAGELKAGEDAPGADGLTHERSCLNCRTPLIGGYCHACGQHAHVHRTLGALAHDLLHSVFHFEGKVWRTIPMLFWNPGALTRRYIHGERANFVSPLALFLFSVFLMFAVFEAVGGPIRPTVNRTVNGDLIAEAELPRALADAKAMSSGLERERAAAVKAGQPTAAIDKRLKDVRDDVEGLLAANAMVNGGSPEDLSSAIKVDTGVKSLDEPFKKALKNPKLLLYKLQSSAYKFSWALIPLSLPFMWLIFAWKREYKLYDHAVFVTYSLAFMMQLLIAMALVAAIGGPSAAALLFVPVQFFWQLRGAYHLSAFGALWRTVTLLFVATNVLLAFGLLLLWLGVSG